MEASYFAKVSNDRAQVHRILDTAQLHFGGSRRCVQFAHTTCLSKRHTSSIQFDSPLFGTQLVMLLFHTEVDVPQRPARKIHTTVKVGHSCHNLRFSTQCKQDLVPNVVWKLHTLRMQDNCTAYCVLQTNTYFFSSTDQRHSSYPGYPKYPAYTLCLAQICPLVLQNSTPPPFAPRNTQAALTSRALKSKGQRSLLALTKSPVFERSSSPTQLPKVNAAWDTHMSHGHCFRDFCCYVSCPAKEQRDM